jgi:processive 1,2-diacylglycerol beta-glucosyltransferase
LSESYSQVIHKVDLGLETPSVLKKILILTARRHEEEDVAAANLRAALDRLAPDRIHIEVLDLLESCYGRFDSLLGRAFRISSSTENRFDGSARLRDSLRDALRRLDPDVVLLTCPLYGLFIQQIYAAGRTRDFTLIALATESAGRELAAAGIEEAKIRLFGFPLQPPRDPSGGSGSRPNLAPGERPRLLYLVNCARKKAPKLLDRLLEHPEWDITACLDDEPELAAVFREKAPAVTAPRCLEILDSSSDLQELFRSHHVVISRADTRILQEAIAARCPLIAPKSGSRAEEANLAQLKLANAGVSARKPREVVDWLERAFRDDARLLALWRTNLTLLGRPDGGPALAHFILEQATVTTVVPVRELRALPAPAVTLPRFTLPARLHRPAKKLLLCDLHTHSTWSDGKLSIAEMVDFYGQRGFDCLCITDHLCDPQRLLGKIVNLTGLVIPPDRVAAYFEAIEREKKRAWARYNLLLMTGVEFNKDGYTAKTSTHLLGVDLKQPIDPSLDIKGLIAEIHAQGGLAIASHPHEMKSHWGKDTLYLWEHVDEYAPLLDAWEVANRDDIFNPVGLKKLPFIASSDFHKPKHIHSWKTVLYCEKEAEAIKHCIRVNRDVSLTLYRDHRFGLDEAPESAPEIAAYQPAPLAAQAG